MRHHPGDDPLAKVRVGFAGDGGLADARVVQQGVLDLARADLVTAALDQVGGLAADDPYVPVGVEGGHVPGAEPAVGGERGGRRFGAVEVAGEQVRAAHLDLTDGRGVCERAAVLLDQAEFDAAQRDADGTGAGFAVGPYARVHERLRHAVPLDDPAAGRRRDPFVVVDRQCRGAGDQQPGAREGLREPAGRGRFGKRFRDAVVHRRHTEQHRAARLQLPGHALGGEPAEVAHGAAPPQRAQDAEDQPVHVEQRQRVDEDVVAGPLPGVLQRVQGGGDGPARQDRALGRAGGAGGVHDQGR